MALLFVTSWANASLMLYKAWLMREFVTGQNLRQWRAWLKALAKFPLATFAGALLTQVTKFTQARVSLLWRRAATRRLMEGYFSGMNYYRLLHHSSVRIEDPDIRICADVQSACDALTGVLITGLSGITMSTVSSWALYHRRGLPALLLPYLYSFGIVPLSFALARPDWSIFSGPQKAYGAYQQALARVQLYGEGISLLRGLEFERAALERRALAWAGEERRSWAALAAFDWLQHFVSSPYMPGVWQTVASFGTSYIALLAAGPGRPVLDPLEPNRAVVYEYGASLSDFWQVFYAVRGASAFMAALDNYKRCSVSLSRIEQLQAALEQLKTESEASSQAHVVDGDVIAFRDVSVVTPTGVKLVAGLTFEVKPGQNLVICGHNGAGKSSIFRCLGRLWPVATGTVTCPHSGGRAGLHGAVYYLPQKPANIVGSLSDQLTYPQRVAGGLSERALRQWLSYARVEHIVDVALETGSLNQEIDWAARLSLGEQQRLGIARVLYHRPQFAILDECTSAVSKDVERWLFEVCRALGISCVTITHRPALQEHHHQMLRLTGALAEDGRGWELVDLASGLPPARTLAASADEAHARIAELLSASGGGGAAPHGGSASPAGSLACSKAPAPAAKGGCDVAAASESLAAKVQRRWPTALRRVAAALQLHSADASLQLRFAWLLGCMFVRPQVAWEVYRTIGGSVSLAMCSDSVGLLSELLLNVAYAAGLAFLDRHIEGVGRELKLDIWLNVSASLHGLSLEGAAFHRMQGCRRSEVESPMQRVADVKLLLDDLKLQLSTTGSLAAQTLCFLPLLLRGGGALPAVTLAGLYATHMLVRTRWMPNFKAITARHGELEERFQVAQTRMRHVAEPVAFCDGGDAERQRLEEHFEHLCAQRLSSMHQEFMYNFLTEFFVVYDNLPIWFHRLLSFNFAYRNEPTGGPSPASAVQNYLYDRTISVSLVGVQAFAQFHQELARIDARATRLLELREALAQVPPPPALAESADGLLAVKDLDLTTPKGLVLAEALTFEVRHGEPLLVTGPNGCGKTALVRVLAGTWPSGGSASIAVPPGGVVTVPQSPYLTVGTLGDQVCYPHRFVPRRDRERAWAALSAVGLAHLLDRAGEAAWDHCCAWEEVLSGGEQQRLALARVLVHRPTLALLDECTSMVAADAEEQLYNVVSSEFGVTPVTFSQRLFLPRLHRRELRLGGPAAEEGPRSGWRLDAIEGRPLGSASRG